MLRDSICSLNNMMSIIDKEFLFELLETPSPVGHEMAGQKIWANFLEKSSSNIECDAYGSVTASLKGSGEKSVMLAAHADEIGFMVKYISDDGFLSLEKLGGSDTATARGRRLRILTDNGEVMGIIGNTAIHLRKNASDEKPAKAHELWVDVGMSTAEAVGKLGIRVGNVAVYEDKPLLLGEDKIVSRALDNKIGGYIIAQVLKNLADRELKHSLICLNAVQEEIGGAGATMASYRHFPNVAIVIDVTHATDTPGIDQKEAGDVKLGKGPTVAHGSANHPLVVKRLIEIAAENDIPIQHEATSNSTGTDADSIYAIKQGIPCALVSLPIRCMHSVVETAQVDDIKNTILLLAAFVASLTDEDDFHHKL